MDSVRIVQRVVRRFQAAARKRPLDPEKMTKLLLWVRKNPKLEKTLKDLWPVFDYLGWKIEEIRGGTKFTAPVGDTFEAQHFFDFIGREYPFMILDSEGVSLDKWLTKNHFQDQALEALQMEPYEAEVERKKQERDERARVGKATCPCCFGPFMLLPKSKKGDSSMPGMVIHGYKRPGVGYLQGECFGNGWPPFELSSNGTKAYEGYLESILKELEKGLGRLERDEDDTLILGPKGYSRESTDPAKWVIYLAEAIKHQGSQIREVSRILDMLKKRLASWEPHPERLGFTTK
jgi:hypothetical protein